MTVHFILESFWFILPAACSNAAASISRKIPWLGHPIDFGKRLGGKPIFGNHKTWRGLISGILTGFIIFLIQQQLVEHAFFRNFGLFDYQAVSPVVGIAFGFGAIGGDLVKSFFKRRINVPPGSSWIPFDQIDWILGSIIVTYPLIRIPFEHMVGILVLGFILHLISKVIGSAVHIDDMRI